MALIDKLFSRKKTLSELSPQELRKEEILLTKHRDDPLSEVVAAGRVRPGVRARGLQLLIRIRRKRWSGRLPKQSSTGECGGHLPSSQFRWHEDRILNITRARDEGE